MEYELRHFDTPLCRFTATEDTSIPEVMVTWVNDAAKHLLPLDMQLTPDSIQKWLKHRTIPKNRAYAQSFLSKCGMSINRPMNIIKVSKGLSLNDCYWVVERGFVGEFSDHNLYDNRFSRVLALIAFTGYGSSVRSSLMSCPEFTTNGMLPKCWRRVGGAIKLYKGGTSGAYNTGNEPYSEFYAAQVARTLGVNAVDYNLSKWQGMLCSACDLFTSKEFSFMPVGRLVTAGGMAAVRKFYRALGQSFSDALDDMLVFDALICNTDRHFGNFGFLVNNSTNTIAAPAPLFDHGNSLFNLAGADAFESERALTEYAATLQPCVYDGFLETAKEAVAIRHGDGLRRLTAFKLKRHPKYNLPAGRLRLIEKQIQNRARYLLED